MRPEPSVKRIDGHNLIQNTEGVGYYPYENEIFKVYYSTNWIVHEPPETESQQASTFESRLAPSQRPQPLSYGFYEVNKLVEGGIRTRGPILMVRVDMPDGRISIKLVESGKSFSTFNATGYIEDPLLKGLNETEYEKDPLLHFLTTFQAKLNPDLNSTRNRLPTLEEQT